MISLVHVTHILIINDDDDDFTIGWSKSYFRINNFVWRLQKMLPQSVDEGNVISNRDILRN